MLRLSPSDLLSRLETLKSKRVWSVEQILHEAGLDWSPKKYREIVKSPNGGSKLNNKDIEIITKFLYDQNFVTNTSASIESISQHHEFMYFSILSFLRCNLETEVETKKLTTGLYRLYRPSLKIPNMFTVGLFIIEENKESGALKVRESRYFRGGSATGEDNYESQPSWSVERPIKEDFEGYLVRKRRRYIAMQRSSNHSNPNFTISIFNDEFVDSDEESRIFSLGGVVFGTVGSRMYMSKVYIERCEDGVSEADLMEEINYVTGDQIKISIKNYLLMESDSFYKVI